MDSLKMPSNAVVIAATDRPNSHNSTSLRRLRRYDRGMDFGFSDQIHRLENLRIHTTMTYESPRLRRVCVVRSETPWTPALGESVVQYTTTTMVSLSSRNSSRSRSAPFGRPGHVSPDFVAAEGRFIPQFSPYWHEPSRQRLANETQVSCIPHDVNRRPRGSRLRYLRRDRRCGALGHACLSTSWAPLPTLILSHTSGTSGRPYPLAKLTRRWTVRNQSWPSSSSTRPPVSTTLTQRFSIPATSTGTSALPSG